MTEKTELPMDTIICACGEDIDSCKRVQNAIEMITTGKIAREHEKGKFFLTTKENFTPDQLSAIRKVAEAACACDQLFDERRSFALYGPDGELVEKLDSDNELDAVREAMVTLETEFDVSELRDDDEEPVGLMDKDEEIEDDDADSP